MNPYVRLYNVGILDDLHNYFPAFLYDQGQFLTLTDVFRYLNQQMYSQFNLFSRGYNEYIRTYPPYVAPQPYATPAPAAPRGPTIRVPATSASTIPGQTVRQSTARTTTGARHPVHMNTTTETIDITPLFTTYLNPGSTFRPAGRGTPTTQTPQQPSHTGGFLAEALISLLTGGSLDPVVVRPSTEEISQATSLRLATRTDEQENCAICQDHYTEGQAIRSLNHCRHAFHKGCIDPWFERNVHCPVCRNDIRQEINGDDL